ncbi:DUF4233 domain-containing protein [Cellulomonas sp. zg-ZUI222]|uniref:DUF4233 domain-containing protein n=1 Tax=Cellulomonas wangleii TaxID=2816956 RepID=A0ABX8D889_9CELL|nr:MULTISPECIES: DUF4233 domain-containing protein [Cellulomonas]MBO0900747.1 DUF4233 domain-containing protein [Cellulomonas sp. zg-ZUI22]MBO0921414.1 DUF4233 domain-containing protein [Cellulomonas wangleii]MBO0925831.1 DUF4233 domain-containing protein [Cellulomonas wangleii]QVI63653.1 DUF4233 domain-containing protein [Cellulomonas wangleii]
MSTQHPAPSRPKRPATPQFTQMTLVLEALLVFFATLVAHGLRVAPTATVWALGGITALILLLLAGYVGRPGGYVAGTVAQVAVLSFGVLVPMMFVIGGVFVVLWAVSLWLGARIDRERAEYDAAHPEG